MLKTPFTALLATLLSFSACNQTTTILEQEQEAPQTVAATDTIVTDSTANPVSCQTTAPLFTPKDESMQDKTLQAYLQQLRQAVQQQDARLLTSLLDTSIATGFDASGGKTSFNAQWHPERKESELWPLLNQLLELGGTFVLQGNSKNLFALPYVYSAWPDTLDAFSFRAVVHDGAILRKEPDINAPAVCTLGRVILKTDYKRSYPQQDYVREKEWWYVESPDGGLKGYVSNTDMYSPVGFRALLNKNKQGRWRMTALVSGD
ncbi:hypothetical protein [Pontibacter liquoris]|uniref:hypothetical protein n=1 Tax=Pontibacter liquoris TaxID=2905677 RepID=UPI001FA7AD6A|nr:hypothetical protein [Pontibacter liquoris]